jgi:hypothetical protein
MTVSLLRLRIAVIALAGVAAVAALAVVVVDRGHDAAPGSRPVSARSPSGTFTFTLPAHWRALAPAQLRKLSRPAVAAYVRDDGAALVAIRRAAAAPVISTEFVRSLDRRFRARLTDYTPVSARVITTSAGGAFFFSYVRRKAGTLDTIVLVPAGARSYVLDSVSNPDSPAATHDVGRIINSFRPR